MTFLHTFPAYCSILKKKKKKNTAKKVVFVWERCCTLCQVSPERLIPAQINIANERQVSAGVRQRAFCRQPGKPVSAPADSQASSANPSETCIEWNWRRSRRRPGRRLPTRELIGRRSRPANRPCVLADDGKSGWLTVRRERREEAENSWERKTSPAWLVRLLNAVTLHTAGVIVCTMSSFSDACKTVRFLIFHCMFFTCEAAPETS